MAETISIQCPHCESTLKLRDRSAEGKRVKCPRCAKPFVVHIPEADDEFGFLEEDLGLYEEDFGSTGEDEFGEAPLPGGRSRSAPQRRRAAASSKKKRSKKKSKAAGWQTPVFIGGGVLLAVGLLVGAFFLGSAALRALGVGKGLDLAYLPADSELFIVANVADLWDSELVQDAINSSDGDSAELKQALDTMREKIGLTPEDIKSVTIGFGGFSEFSRGGAGGMPDLSKVSFVAVVRTNKDIDISKLLDALPAEEASHEGTAYHRLPLPGQTAVAAFLPTERTLVVGAEKDVQAAITSGGKPADRDDLDFIRGGHDLMVAVVPRDPSVFQKSNPVSMMGSLPLAGGSANPGSTLDGKLRGFCFGVSLSSRLQLGGELDCTDAEAAKQAVAELEKALERAREDFDLKRQELEVRNRRLREDLESMPADRRERMEKQIAQLEESVELAADALDSISVSRSGTTIRLSAKIAIPEKTDASEPRLPIASLLRRSNPLAGLMDMNFGGGRPGGGLGNPAGDSGSSLSGITSSGNPAEAAARARSRNNLKQIALAMHNYHDTHRSFPPAYTTDANGRPLLSWRVHILPFLNEAALYNQFHLNEPWDSPHNRALISRMPDVYAHPLSKSAGQGKTNYLTVRGDTTAFPGSEPISLAKVTDGSSNTAMVVEVDDAHAVEWTRPDDFAFNETAPGSGLGDHFQAGFHMVFCDGYVATVPRSASANFLRAVFTRDGRESIDFKSFSAMAPARAGTFPSLQRPGGSSANASTASSTPKKPATAPKNTPATTKARAGAFSRPTPRPGGISRTPPIGRNPLAQPAGPMQVVVVKTSGFKGRGSPAGAARLALFRARLPWMNLGQIQVDPEGKEIVIGVRRTGNAAIKPEPEPVRQILQGAGFTVENVEVQTKPAP